MKAKEESIKRKYGKLHYKKGVQVKKITKNKFKMQMTDLEKYLQYLYPSILITQ